MRGCRRFNERYPDDKLDADDLFRLLDFDGLLAVAVLRIVRVSL